MGEWEGLFAGGASELSRGRYTRPSWAKAYAKVARLEYLPAEILLITIPVLLVFNDPHDILSLKFAESVAVFFLLYFTGFMANALADRSVDAKYISYKASIAKAVEVIGLRNLKLILVSHMAIAVLLSIHLSLLTDNFLLMLFVLLGLFLGIGYSLGPFHFKTRGVAHGLALASSAFFLPMAFIIVTLTGQIDFTLFMFVLGFTLAMYSLEFGNQAMDYYEDKSADIRTPSVRYSIRRTVQFSLALLVIGLLITSLTIGFRLVPKLWAISPIFGELATILVPVVMVLGFLEPAIGLGRIYQGTTPVKGSIVADPVRIRMALRSVDHPKWQTSGASSVVILCLLMFAGVLFPLLQTNNQHENFDSVPSVNILNNPDMVVNVGDAVDFKAEVVDDGGHITLFWNFGDGTGVGGSLNATHRYTKIGVYTVEFRVVDNAGHEVRHWINLTVTMLYFSKLELHAKKFLTYTRIYYDYNVTNDKDLKHQDELVVKIYYQDFLVFSKGLSEDLFPARVWPNQGFKDIATLETHPELRVLLLQNVGDKQIVIEDRTVQS